MAFVIIFLRYFTAITKVVFAVFLRWSMVFAIIMPLNLIILFF
ncbi:hypothetical protein P20429_1369 [Pseudoalteromonas sp. BSi20429]|nr:hypothetical protein P20429_1369 [Pseudoalteromonas sp. BSi20429]